MDLELEDKICLVSGSSRGIGKGVAERFLQLGAKTVLTGRDRVTLSRAHNELAARYGTERILSFPGDLCDTTIAETIVAVVVETWGAVDCLVANVGSGSSTPGWDLNKDVWEKAFAANFWPAVAIISAALPHMVNAKSGSITLISSIAGLEATAAPLAYGAAKASLTHFAKNLARLVGPENVRVNTVAPGNILFDGGSWERHLQNRKDEVLAYINAEVPLKRFGKVEEIADCVVFLASPRASFITGACLVADGGQSRCI